MLMATKKGKEVEVLFEEKDGECIKGHTENYIVVKVKNKNVHKYHNEIARVEIVGVGLEVMYGEIL